MTDIWRGTYADIPASVQMVGSTPRAFLGERMVYGEDEIGIFRKTLASMAETRPDPRPSDMAELASLAAIELRETHGIRAMQSGKFGVFVGLYYYDMACKENWSDLGPIAIALEIKKLEAIRAMQDARDT